MDPQQKRERLQNVLLAIADLLELDLEVAQRRPATDGQATASARQASRQDPDDRLWDAGDTAKFLQVSRSWVYKQAELGTLPCIRLGSLLRFEPEAIKRFAGLSVPERPQPVRKAAIAGPVPLSTPPIQRPASPEVSRPPPPPHRPMLNLPEHFVSVREAAKQLGVSTATIYKLCEQGKLPHHRVLNAIRILPSELAAFAKAIEPVIVRNR